MDKCPMPFLPSLPDDAGPPSIFALYPEIYEPWAHMSQAMMCGSSPLGEGERELILAFAAGLGGCEFVCVAHAEVAYAWGIEEGLVARLIEDFEGTPVDARLRPLLIYVRKLCMEPDSLGQSDADAIFLEGWNEAALHTVVVITARAVFMQRLVQGIGFEPLSQVVAAKHAVKRVRNGYVNLYSVFRNKEEPPRNQGS